MTAVNRHRLLLRTTNRAFLLRRQRPTYNAQVNPAPLLPSPSHAKPSLYASTPVRDGTLVSRTSRVYRIRRNGRSKPAAEEMFRTLISRDDRLSSWVPDIIGRRMAVWELAADEERVEAEMYTLSHIWVNDK